VTLAPESRVLLTDALRPPAGYGIDVAVGTTYSLDLMSMLLAPLSFALHDRISSSEVENSDPVRLLEAVRRYADKTTVFCQAGGIDIPSAYRSILTFIEDSVLEVVPPREGAIFHPKVWALRFKSEGGDVLHRAVIMSRNLTQDRSWDTALVLDEEQDAPIDAAPLAAFVSGLGNLALYEVSGARAADIASLTRSLATVRFAAPSPFTSGELLPIGLDGTKVWPFPSEAKRLLAISPFLTKAAVAELAGIAPDRTLISRMESLEYVGGRALEGWDLNVLQRIAEVESGEDVGEAERTLNEITGTREGLHAKTFAIDLAGGESMVVTGSANLTSRRWGNNVEFDAVLTGRTKDCGVACVLDGTTDAPGLFRVLEPVTITEPDGIDDPQITTNYAIEAFHRALAERGVALDVAAIDDDRVEVTLAVDLPAGTVGQTTVWLVSLPREGHARPLESRPKWTIARDNVTPFVAIETTAGEGDARVTRRCVLKANLTGDVADRRKNALASVLKTPQDVLRYLVFLLGDPAYDALLAEVAGAEGGGRWSAGPTGSSIDVALFEPMVRATGRDEGALARIENAVHDIREASGGRELLPEGFDELWDVVWTVHQERLT